MFGLNLYGLTTTNPLCVAFAAYTMFTSIELYYDGEYQTWWQQHGKWVLLKIGIIATIVAIIAAPFTCGASSAGLAIASTLVNIAVGTGLCINCGQIVLCFLFKRDR